MKKLFVLFAFLPQLMFAANPSFQSFDATDFGTNAVGVWVKSNKWATLNAATNAARAAVLDMNLQTGLTGYAAMSNAVPAFIGQLGISYYSRGAANQAPIIWIAYGVSTGQWGPFYQHNGIPTIGSFYSMANVGLSSADWIANGNPQSQTYDYATSVGDGVLARVYNMNPFQSGGGFFFPMTGTNAVYRGYTGVPLSTNANGVRINMYDGNAFFVGMTSPNFVDNIGNGMATLVTDPHIPLQICTAFGGAGEAHAFRTHLYVESGGVGVPQYKLNIYDPSYAGNDWCFYASLANNVVTNANLVVRSNAYFYGAVASSMKVLGALGVNDRVVLGSTNFYSSESVQVYGDGSSPNNQTVLIKSTNSGWGPTLILNGTASSGGHSYGLTASGVSDPSGPGFLNIYDYTAGTYRFWMNSSGNAKFYNALGILGRLTNENLTASTVLYADASKVLTSSATTPTELGYLHGVTGDIQTQFAGKLNKVGGAATSLDVDGLYLHAVTGEFVLTTDEFGRVQNSEVSAQELSLLSGMTSLASAPFTITTNFTAGQVIVHDPRITSTIKYSGKYWATNGVVNSWGELPSGRTNTTYLVLKSSNGTDNNGIDLTFFP